MSALHGWFSTMIRSPISRMIGYPDAALPQSPVSLATCRLTECGRLLCINVLDHVESFDETDLAMLNSG